MRDAVLGDDPEELENAVLTRFRETAEEEQGARAESLRLQMTAIRRIIQYLRPGGSSILATAAMSAPNENDFVATIRRAVARFRHGPAPKASRRSRGNWDRSASWAGSWSPHCWRGCFWAGGSIAISSPACSGPPP